MKIISAAVIAGLAAVTAGFPAGAQNSPISGFLSGNKLLELCETPFGTDSQAWCDAYIVGVADGLTLTDAVSAAASKLNPGANSGQPDPVVRRYYCLDAHVTLGQTSAAVLDYLRAHPEKLDMIASQLVIAALAQAFPCPGP